MSRDSKRMLKPIIVVLSYPGNLGACLYPALFKINSSIVASKQRARDPASWANIGKKVTGRPLSLGSLTLQALTISHACAFPLPKISNLDGSSNLVPLLPIANLGNTFLFVTPWKT